MKKIILSGHVGGYLLEELVEDTPITTEIVLCKYSTECNKTCPEITPCRTKTFYEKYGTNYRELGVGA